MTTLLYIDDADADIELMRALLGQRHIRVEAERTGAKGIAAYNPERHSAVVIDWNLPDMDGVGVAKSLLEHYPKCPIAFISGTFEDKHINSAAELGLNQCFEKKMSMEHIQRISAFVKNPTSTGQAL